MPPPLLGTAPFVDPKAQFALLALLAVPVVLSALNHAVSIWKNTRPVPAPGEVFASKEDVAHVASDLETLKKEFQAGQDKQDRVMAQGFEELRLRQDRTLEAIREVAEGVAFMKGQLSLPARKGGAA